MLERTHKIYGPPGTGKTTYLLSVLERELKNGVPPNKIAFVTFTTAARLEALDRVRAAFGFEIKDLPYFKTLHAVAYHELGISHKELIVGPKDLKPLGDLLKIEFKGKWVDTDDLDFMPVGIGDGDKLLAFDHFRRHSLMNVQDAYKTWDGEATYFELKRFCDAYEAWKQQETMVDFTDLLEYVVEPLPVDVVIVDESQDLSKLQWRALDVFARNAKRIYLAGDDDQAIFTWAGADAETFIGRPGTVRVLDQSYRLPRRVFRQAETIVRGIKIRQPKIWRPRDEEGTLGRAIDPRHVDYTREGSYLILYRNHYQGKMFEDHLRELGLPYSRADKPAPGGQWAQSIFLWERLRKSETLTVQEVEVVYDAMTIDHGITRTAKKSVQEAPEDKVFTLDELTRDYGLKTTDPWFEALGKISKTDVMYLRRLLKNYGAKILRQESQIKMSTIHAAKGRQADNVVLLTDMSYQTRMSFERNPDNERRVFYVGVTRAISNLTLVGIDNPIF